MKKFFLSCLVAAVAATFAACAKEGKESIPANENNLIGRWEVYKYTEYQPENEDQDEKYDVSEEFGEENGFCVFFVFDNNSTMQIIQQEYYNGIWHTEYNPKIKYVLSGNKLLFENPWTIEKLTDNELILKLDYYSNGMVCTYYLERV